MGIHFKPFDMNPLNINLGGGLVLDFNDKEEVDEEVDEIQDDGTIKKVTKIVEKDKDFIDLSPF